jgi:Putative adhesin
MSTGLSAPPPPSTRRGLPRAFVALCVLIGAFVGVYVVVSLLSITTASTEHRTRTFQAVDALGIDAGSGDVEIVGERREDIRIDMEIQRGMWRGAWQPELDLTSDNRELSVASECSLWAHIGVTDCGASFTIRVPRGTEVQANASSGDVTVAGLTGRVVLDTSSGDVHATDMAGSLVIGSSSGDIEVVRHRGGELDASSSSGDVDVEVSRPLRRLDLAASSGDVTAVVPDVRYRVVVATGSGDEDVNVQQDPDAARLIDVKASSGDVTVRRLGDAP